MIKCNNINVCLECGFYNVYLEYCMDYLVYCYDCLECCELTLFMQVHIDPWEALSIIYINKGSNSKSTTRIHMISRMVLQWQPLKVSLDTAYKVVVCVLPFMSYSDIYDLF